MSTARSVATVAASAAATATQEVLRADAIAKRFGTTTVLGGVSLRACAGDVTALIGASGSGKSTFLRCLNLLETPDTGAITLAGETLRLEDDGRGSQRATDRRQLQRFRARVAMVFQHFNLWAHMTVLQNVMGPPIVVGKRSRAEARATAERYLSRVGVWHRRDAYPAHLSGGEQQRVAIARALAMEPEVMLFDEPTSALDPEMVGEVLRVMRDLAAEGRTMIVVTHEMAFARDVASHVVFLANGRIEEQGAPTDVLQHPASPRLQAFVAGARR